MQLQAALVSTRHGIRFRYGPGTIPEANRLSTAERHGHAADAWRTGSGGRAYAVLSGRGARNSSAETGDSRPKVFCEEWANLSSPRKPGWQNWWRRLVVYLWANAAARFHKKKFWD